MTVQIAGPDLPINPRHGVHRPTSGTPARVPGSVRRTSTIDSLRSQGIGGPVTVIARARDLVTPFDGAPEPAGTTELEVDIDYPGGYLIDRIQARPEEPRLQELLGRRASAGFRAAVTTLLPDLQADKALLHLLLDDLPGALLVSGYAVQRAGTPGIRPAGPVLQQSDLCAGWRADGTIMDEVNASGHAPVVTGPVAPALDTAEDPLAWHQMPPLPAHGMRRRRRVDVVEGADGELQIEALLRDSHMSVSGVETSIHEYVVTAVVDRQSLRVLHAQSQAHALPWVECNVAVRSSSDVVGQVVGELRSWVRSEMTGIRTCTHLNDTLRSLDDVAALRDLLPRR